MEENTHKNACYLIEIHFLNGTMLEETAEINHLNSKIQEIKKKYSHIKEIKIYK